MSVSRLPARAMTERQLQQCIIDLCRLFHLLCYHTRDSRGSAAGFPDLNIVGPRGIIYAELKSAHGKTSIDQRCWEAGIREAGGTYYLWRPEDWHSGDIRQVLEGLCARAPERPAARPSGRARWAELIDYPGGPSNGR